MTNTVGGSGKLVQDAGMHGDVVLAEATGVEQPKVPFVQHLVAQQNRQKLLTVISNYVLAEYFDHLWWHSLSICKLQKALLEDRLRYIFFTISLCGSVRWCGSYVVSDVLKLSDSDVASFVEEFLVSPVWVEFVKYTCDTVVMTQPKSLEFGNTQL